MTCSLYIIASVAIFCSLSLSIARHCNRVCIANKCFVFFVAFNKIHITFSDKRRVK